MSAIARDAWSCASAMLVSISTSEDDPVATSVHDRLVQNDGHCELETCSLQDYLIASAEIIQAAEVLSLMAHAILPARTVAPVRA